MKFFDILKEKLKAKGMQQVEELAEVVYECVKETALEVAAASSNNIVRALVPPAVMALDGVAKDVVDKIDGQEG